MERGLMSGSVPEIQEPTMRQAPNLANPFIMLTSPDTILAAVERSERLNRLSRKVYRPLDRPLIPKIGARDTAEFDRAIDDAEIPDAELAALEDDLA
jgi:hypothetical protein